MEQLPLFNNNENDPLTNPLVKPEFSNFPDGENIIDIYWNLEMGRWIAMYKPDDPGEMYKR